MAGNLTRLPVAFADVFFHGAYLLDVGPQRDFERSTVDRVVQQVDEDTGKPVWVAEVLTADPKAQQKTVKVKIVADYQPVPPEATNGSPFRAVEFDGLSVTPYVDRDRCKPPRKGEAHFCKARQAYALYATGMHAPGEKPNGQAQPGHAVPKGSS